MPLIEFKFYKFWQGILQLYQIWAPSFIGILQRFCLDFKKTFFPEHLTMGDSFYQSKDHFELSSRSVNTKRLNKSFFVSRRPKKKINVLSLCSNKIEHKNFAMYKMFSCHIKVKFYLFLDLLLLLLLLLLLVLLLLLLSLLLLLLLLFGIVYIFVVALW